MSRLVEALKISREGIREIYAQGEESVINLVERLIEELNKQDIRLEALERQQKKNSQNSSKPPSSDGLKRLPKSLRTKSEKKSGGQIGHEGSNLEWSTAIDYVETHKVSECGECGSQLGEIAALEWEIRQVHDLPPISLRVTEHQAEIKYCPHCHQENRGVFPADVNSGVQYGSGLKGLMVYLIDYQLLPSERACELLSDVLGCKISEGTIYNSRQKCFEKLETVESRIITAIQNAAVSNFDETGIHINGKLHWLHVASNEDLTYYYVHAKRGKVAMDEMNILPEFHGVSVHDGWSSYAKYDCSHALCNAHHLRELKYIAEQYQQPWATEMSSLLVEIKDHIEEIKAFGQQALSPENLQLFRALYQKLLSTGLAANPPVPHNPDSPKSRGRPKQSPAKNLLDRLLLQQEQVLAFMLDFRVPFDNNQAERDIRMTKVKQKISGGFRSFLGAQIFCRIRGYISTLKKQGLSVLNALKLLFLDNPILPALKPE
jgi:transposase